ncbi:MAG: hypothetical protein AB1489_27415 [Acidobacteriota bacterium]
MLETPFDIISCSWPRPVKQLDGQWISEPEWNAPLMSSLPQPSWQSIQDEACWIIDWCDFFSGGLRSQGASLAGEMRGFHVVFKLRINGSGTLVFWDDDGCVIRHNGNIIHTDPSAHTLKRNEISVQMGDHLEIAQWQHYGGWVWGAKLILAEENEQALSDLLLPYLDIVQQRLKKPNGPPLKTYFSGQTPLRTVVSLYSMILNGYSPTKVLVFGEHQWSQQNRQLFAKLLPFAQVISMNSVFKHIQALRVPRLAEFARRHWFVLKTCIALLYPPKEFCLMDDDIFVLDSVADALHAFETHNLVFTPDADHGEAYLAAWGWIERENRILSTGRLNAGLYWLRNSYSTRRLAAHMTHVLPSNIHSWVWEQGFIAVQYNDETNLQLPSERYFYPVFDGLPGGVLGYDYAHNPCGFTSIHFGGLATKPSDSQALVLAQEILNRSGRE